MHAHHPPGLADFEHHCVGNERVRTSSQRGCGTPDLGVQIAETRPEGPGLSEDSALIYPPLCQRWPVVALLRRGYARTHFGSIPMGPELRWLRVGPIIGVANSAQIVRALP